MGTRHSRSFSAGYPSSHQKSDPGSIASVFYRLQLADLIGLDTVLAIARVLHRGFSDARYRPSPLLVKYVEAGWLGRKSGRGFYKYESA